MRASAGVVRVHMETPAVRSPGALAIGSLAFVGLAAPVTKPEPVAKAPCRR
jgi:hypothetical protein